MEEAIADLKSQVYELKKNQIDADSIYGFLNAFNELYAECTDAEKKQFMQAFIERIDIFPERREDGNWIRNIRFQFPCGIGAYQRIRLRYAVRFRCEKAVFPEAYQGAWLL